MAAECGTSGNTFWTFTGTAPIDHVVVGDLGLYVVQGTKLSLVDFNTGGEIASRDFLTVTLGRPIVFTPRNPVNGASTEVVVAGSDGFVYGLHPATLANNWTRSTRRPTCSADGITATPVVQLWKSSDPSFQAAMSTDVVMVGTHYGCGTTTANRVYGLNAETGAILWVVNALSTYTQDTVNGLAVDYARNTVYVAMGKTDPTVFQFTLVALNTTSGARRWAQDLGPIASEPVLAAGRLYVATYAGTLAAFDPDAPGSALWSATLTSGGDKIERRLAVAYPRQTGSPFSVFLYVVDTGGTLHAYFDGCATRGPIWSNKPGSAKFCTSPLILNYSLYVGADDGKVYQLDPTNGAIQSYATVSVPAASAEPVATFQSWWNRLYASAGTKLKKLCIPWNSDGIDKAYLDVPPRFHQDSPSALMGVRVSPDLTRARRTHSRVGRSGS